MKDERNFVLSYDDILKANNSPSINRITVEDRFDYLNDYYSNGFPSGESSGITSIDPIFKWKKGRVFLFTGYPGSGKSEILKWLSVLRVKSKGEKVLMFSPESDIDELIDDLARMYIGQNTNRNFPNQCPPESYLKAIEWVNQWYEFVEFDEMPTVQTLLDHYSDAVDRGFGFFVTDPFNYVAEGSADDGNGISRYLKTALSHMKTFAKRNNVINVIVEHPNQPKPDFDNKIPRVSQFRINGGAMWNNKMDCIVGITRNWNDSTIIFETLKMKSQRYNGVPGEVVLDFDIQTGRYK
jgi:energy-coupling factor transporter ATP-binding protein EcfA2